MAGLVPGQRSTGWRCHASDPRQGTRAENERGSGILRPPYWPLCPTSTRTRRPEQRTGVSSDADPDRHRGGKPGASEITNLPTTESPRTDVFGGTSRALRSHIRDGSAMDSGRTTSSPSNAEGTGPLPPRRSDAAPEDQGRIAQSSQDGGHRLTSRMPRAPRPLEERLPDRRPSSPRRAGGASIIGCARSYRSRFGNDWGVLEEPASSSAHTTAR